MDARTPRSVRPRIAVVGAGAAGVSAAWWLHRGGCDPVLFDRADHVGGRAATRVSDGYRFDVGAGALASTGAAARRLMMSVGVFDEVVPRGVVIGVRTEDGRIHRVARRRPWSVARFEALDASSRWSLLRLAPDLARVWSRIDDLDLSAAARLDTMTVHDFLTARYSSQARDNLLGAFMRGKLLVDPTRTSVVDLFAAIKAFLVAGHIWTHPDGIGFFLRRAADRLDVRTGTRVTAVRESPDAVRVDIEHAGDQRTETFDACVLAVPTSVLLDVHPGLDDARRSFLRQLEYSTAVVVGIGVRDAPDETASVIVRPASTDTDMPAVGLGHRLAPGRTPPGGGILTAFWMSDWSHRHIDDSDTTIIDRTVDELHTLFPAWPLQVIATAVGRWPQAMVASRVGTFRSLSGFVELSRRDRRIQIAGDFLAQTSINAGIGAGEMMARRLLRLFRRGERACDG